MHTAILSREQIERAVFYLRQGEPVAIPTETVYGLAAPIFNPLAVQKVFQLKKRPSDNPLIAHVATLSMVESIAQDIPPMFHVLQRVFWPGPLTLILRKRKEVPDIATGGLATVAIRMPSHPIALRLIEAIGEPLVAPSANLSGKPSPTCVEHVLEDFEGQLEAVLDGGSCSIGIESTVVSLLGEKPVLLRPGMISKADLERVLQQDILTASSSKLSPGMNYRHYAPKTPIRLVTTLPVECGDDSFILSTAPTGRALYRPLNAKMLYAFFREADRLRAKEIFVLLDSVSLADEALMNRLNKASEGV